MIRTKLQWLSLFVFLCFILTACGGDESSDDFQTNRDPAFELANITEGYGAVDDAWNSVDTTGFNTRLEETIDADSESYEIASYALADTLTDPYEPLAELVRTDLSNVLARLVDTRATHRENMADIDAFFKTDAEEQTRNFYAFLDNMSSDGLEVPDDYLSGMIDKLVDYAIQSIPDDGSGQPDKAWLNDKMGEMVDDLLDEDFQGDFIDLTKAVSKLTNQTDFPMWLDDTGLPVQRDDIQPSVHTNTDLGNAVQGTHDLVTWFNKIVQNPDTNPLIHDAVASLLNLFDPELLSPVLRQLIVNIEDHFTVGGEVYTSNSLYNENSDTTYSDAELTETLRAIFPSVQKLFIRSDRPNAMISTAADQTPVYPFEVMLSNLRSIGFDPDNIDIERSIYDLLRYDTFGRDRISDPEAWASPYLESLLFLTFATSHHGWLDGGQTGEVTRPTDSRSAHGHGAYVENLTLNDSLFSMNMLKSFGVLGLYELGLKPTDGNHLYRTKTPFTLSEVDNLHTGTVSGDDKDYRFFFDSNYTSLNFLASGAGDLGSPDGGNADGRSLGMNQYRPYDPTGRHVTQLSSWTMSWGIRACFRGEGPYYYADPNAETVSVDGETYRKYLRPDGKIYALVSLDGLTYLYPTDEGDVEDSETDVLSFNDKPQRANRYKSQWHSDYYVSHFDQDTGPEADQGHRYFTLDNSSGDTMLREISGDPDAPAGSLVYNEVISETDPARACATREEAFFRNYQWVNNEKKMVFVQPIYMEEGLSGLKAAAYIVVEANGISGLSLSRKYRERGVWAKKNETGPSSIPGDYRIEVVAQAVNWGEFLINSDAIYDDNLDCGNTNPAIIAHNLHAAYRLGFPRSPEMDRDNNVTDRILGSKEFVVGDNEIWNNRNAFMPILKSLLAALHEYTPDPASEERKDGAAGLPMFFTHAPVLIKPLYYYNRDAGPEGPADSWVPRVYGTESYGNYRGHPFLQSTSDLYDGTPDTFFGSWHERLHFQAAVMKTHLNILIDSDITSDETDAYGEMQHRCDGILPLLTTRTKALSHFFKLILNPSVDPLPLEQALSTIKYTKGELTAINQSSASGKNVVFPDWMFATGVEATKDAYGAYTEYTNVRDEDIILDDILDTLVGHDAVDADNEGYGIADYPDDKTEDADWEDFNDAVDTVCDLLHNDSPNSITPNLLWLMDRVFGRDRLYTSAEISGLLYKIGDLFGYFDSSSGRWVYQGEDRHNDLYNMLTSRVPDMYSVVIQNEVENPDDAGGPPDFYGYGDRYYAQLIFLKNLGGPDGLIHFLLNTISVTQDWEEILSDLNRFLDGPDVSDPESPLWPTLADLLRDMAKAVGETNNGNLVDQILEDYGFQIN
jgi:hypothetical protein